jgi:hypothetical protein
MVLSWYRRWMKNYLRPAARPRRSRSTRLRLEALEERALMSVDITRMPAGTPLGTVLILDSTVVPATGANGTFSKEANEAIAKGYAVRDVSGDIWDSLTQAQFASYSALILGDPDCVGGTASIAAAVSNKNVWGPVVAGSTGGNVVVVGTDPVFHSFGGIAGATKVVNESVDWALNQTGKTGLVLDLSCYYVGSPSNTAVPILDIFGAGSFAVNGNVACTDSGHVTATTPAGQPFHDLTETDLSSWSCSVHEAFDKFDPTFTVLAIDKNVGSSYTAPDGTKGDPYILVRGAGVTVISNIQLAPATDTKMTGASETLTATVTTGGSPAAGKTVTFTVFSGPNAGKTGTAVTDTAGHATFTYTSSVAGTDFVHAQFVDSSGATETSGNAQITWTAPTSFATSTAVASDLNPSTYGLTVHFTATVTSSGGTPTGSVQFFDGTTSLGTATLSGGSASIPVSTLTAGDHSITAQYAGAGLFMASTSPVLTEHVAKATPTVSVTGGTFTYDGTAHPATGSVTGVGGASLGAPTFTYNGVSAAPVNAGTYAVVASFAGNANYNAASSTATIVINKATPSLTNLSSATIVVGTASTVLSGTITAGSLVPTGSVTISVPGSTVSAPITSANGTFSAALPTGALAVGTYTITYSYGGDGNFNTASGTGTLKVTYAVSVQSDLDHAKEAGSDIPIQIALTGADGTNLSSAGPAVTAIGFAPVSNPTAVMPVEAAGDSNPGNVFRVEGGSNPFYQYNLKTATDLAPGSYLLFFTVAGDPLVHSVMFQVM